MSAEALQTALAKLRDAGVRMTPQRHAILSYLLKTMSHPTVDEIYKSLEEKFPNMSVATIYNNLRVFKDVGLVRELTYGDASSRYDANMNEHYHAVCTNCGAVKDFYYPSLAQVEKEAAKATGFEVSSHRLEVYGLCEDCRIKQ
ncbi:MULTISPECIES: Fur family transcriptional regulator [Aneurinibacillus]|uniref:Fur family transcriptional regulator, peroxide stress response regulator n=1 Tax=Aneurinibacillus thermoaerophilus TaxID=143495 RepID=A0A1G8FST1_ANETH|nr:MULTISPECIES: Fur family transcriptional regulator [Aneurinibacillus]AMA74054.1 Fur family transcriptional regulator [Aneurinibacillus sp. XH2]MED0677682.1 Fur family transcriptional regulator [Aneurinibacillus thermoaerophilus]MED0681456.1 Fur family transcriptional regulator [Aneurinibacillus thermoaerophilus]MED0739030.1 Fur family transcriptional regulator [Aneurinibacillus thermoaerophilus]MED0759165.1 Fur family transcriptional regulator [Aneurinibacillus thermoaerophilus]